MASRLLSVVRRLPAWHLVLSVAAAARVELALHRRSLPATARALGLVVTPPPTGGAPTSAPTSAAPARLPRWTAEPLRATATVMRWWPLGQDGPRGSAMCLRRSLVLAWRLRSLRASVSIGVALADLADPTAPTGAADAGPTPASRAGGAQVRAHAWVEVDGTPLDRGAGGYTVMTTLLPHAGDGVAVLA